MPKSTGERWMSVAEAAEYLGVVLRPMCRRIKPGELGHLDPPRMAE